ncbi:uncharacterized protein [Gossypium hirsutum]|uniref:Retrotransposon gag domain-containing protein n=1 Tax=Gossypium hirsutum TaxID=3635 RepID=A0A1U8IB96_GOSHI|nr:uncharacterized protein LOC107894639 [Gossypium hirsutum]
MDDLDCNPEQKLKGAIYLLRDGSYQWWLTVKEGTQPNRLTWEFFKTTFQSKYVGASYIDTCRGEFLNLTQSDRSVAEYEAKFLRLSRYARGMVALEYERCVRFEDDLRDNLRVLIALQREREFSILDRDRERGKEKRHSEPSSFVPRSKKKARSDGSVRVGAPVASVVPTRLQSCDDCGRRHLGECWRRNGACLRCGSLEHRIRECPQCTDQMQAPAPGSVQPQRAVQQPPRGHGQVGVVTVWVMDGEHRAEVLVRVRRSSLLWFILHFTERTKMLLTSSLSTSSEVTMISPLEQSIQRVVLRTKDDVEVVMIGEHRDYLLYMIFVLLIEKLVRKGCEVYLVYVSVSDSRDSSVRNIRTVKDFSNAFLEELLGLPPNQEVEFRIELLSNTARCPSLPTVWHRRSLQSLKLNCRNF